MLKRNIEKIINSLPKTIRKKVLRFIYRLSEKKMLKKAVVYYSSEENLAGFSKPDRLKIKKMVEGMKAEPFTPFYGMSQNIRRKYKQREVAVSKDKENALFYIIVDGKRLYFARGMDKSEIQRYWNGVSLEQDRSSPHRYFSDGEYFVGEIPNDDNKVYSKRFFGVEAGDTVIDLGGAEGNFSLSVVDKAEKVYIVEADSDWCEALKATFAPYGEKVRIINKFISDTSDENSINIKKLLSEENSEVNLIKFDIEGFEEPVIRSSLEIFKNATNLKLAVCTYHRPQDEILFAAILQELGFSVSFTEGYMLFPDNVMPCIRKGLIRAIKKEGLK